jgi:hypothetical protein
MADENSQVMAPQQTMPNNVNANISGNSATQGQQQLAKPMFHDFLGMKKPADSAMGFSPKAAYSQSASESLGASSSGARGLISTTSYLGSERQVGNHLKGIPFYGPRSNIYGHEISNRIVGSRRNNPYSAFMGSSREGILDHDSFDNSELLLACGASTLGRFSSNLTAQSIGIKTELGFTFCCVSTRPSTSSCRKYPWKDLGALGIPLSLSPTRQHSFHEIEIFIKPSSSVFFFFEGTEGHNG